MRLRVQFGESGIEFHKYHHGGMLSVASFQPAKRFFFLPKS